MAAARRVPPFLEPRAGHSNSRATATNRWQAMRSAHLLRRLPSFVAGWKCRARTQVALLKKKAPRAKWPVDGPSFFFLCAGTKEMRPRVPFPEDVFLGGIVCKKKKIFFLGDHRCICETARSRRRWRRWCGRSTPLRAAKREPSCSRCRSSLHRSLIIS